MDLAQILFVLRESDRTQGLDSFFALTPPRIQPTFAEFSEVQGSELNWGGFSQKIVKRIRIWI